MFYYISPHDLASLYDFNKCFFMLWHTMGIRRKKETRGEIFQLCLVVMINQSGANPERYGL